MGSGKGGAAGRSPLKNRGTRKRSCGHKLYANLVDSGKEKSLLRGRGLRFSKKSGHPGTRAGALSVDDRDRYERIAGNLDSGRLRKGGGRIYWADQVRRRVVTQLVAAEPPTLKTTPISG